MATKFFRGLAILLGACILGAAQAETTKPDNIGHEHHRHPHGAPHPRDPDPVRFLTDRQGRPLDLPLEEDMFSFVVFGDRTGGPVGGVSVLADAVRDTNLLEPDLVMTVGDLVNGYNQTGQWLQQADEFKGIMDELVCPWFPVAGNHDVYWRGPGRPPGEHEADYEKHFAPLWYAFEHKNCWFIVLYTDEGDPATGEKAFDRPTHQRMSPEQTAWLDQTLTRTAGADHVFVFVHHPRWLGGGYGDDWERIHHRLVAAGNVSAVFGGHIHRMHYAGPRDGIEYVTLATTGGANSELVPRAGWLHHFDIVTVRRESLSLAAVPVGQLLDVRGLKADLIAETEQLARLIPPMRPALHVDSGGAAEGAVEVTVSNPSTRVVEVTLLPNSGDSRWLVYPDHAHAALEPGGQRSFTFGVTRPAGSLDLAFRQLELAVDMDVLTEGFRISMPSRRFAVPLDVEVRAPAVPAREHALLLDGVRDYVELPDRMEKLPDGPLTLECWFRADSIADRVGLVSKMEVSDYGLMIGKGVPAFFVLLGNTYAAAKAPAPLIEVGRWYHIAGVFDGAEIRLYVDGKQVAAAPASGRRRRRPMPLLVGADVDATGGATSMFHGAIDAVHLSKVARHTGATFTPDRRPTADADSLLLLNMDAPVGPWLFDESPVHAHPSLRGAPGIWGR